MTCPHFAYSIIYKSSKSSLIASAAYNARRSIYDELEHKVKNSRSKINDYVTDEMLLPPGAPKQYQDVKRIFNDIQKIENDKLAYKMMFSFQWELTYEQNLALIKELLQQEFISKGHAVHIAIHGTNPKNTHCHAIAIDRRLIDGKWETHKSETVYYRRGTVKKLDKHGRVINPDAEILTTSDKINTPKLKNKRLQFDADGNIIFEKGWQELQYDDNGKPMLDANGYPVMVDIREPDYDPVTGKQKYSKNGKYKTYYVMGSNCCYLVDDILGNSGMDILSINGIITPGTYYDYFNKELSKKNSNVVSKSIYNARRRAGNTKN